jgi:hypothetical protein
MAAVGVLFLGLGGVIIYTMAIQGLSPSDAWSEVKTALRLH